MAAFVASLISLLWPQLRTNSFRGVAGHSESAIPLPAISHVVVADEVIRRFQEVVVIGDVHGCFDELKDLLQLVHGNDDDAAKVLKVFVGDLVNKGPQNRQVIDFMLDPKNSDSCISVRGNHDDLVIDQVLNVIRKDPQSLRPKNKWMEEVREEELRFLMDLPYSITIPSLNALVVHAGLIPGVAVQDMSPRDLVSMRNVVEENGRLKATRSHEEGKAWAKSWHGPQHVYFGHDAKRLLQRETHATGLDTGCVYGKELTGVFIKGRRKGEFISVKAKSVHQDVE